MAAKLKALPPKALTKDELGEFKRLKKVVADGLESFVDVGNALLAIRDNEYYRENHKTFETFCKSEWDLPRAYAYRLIGSAQVVNSLSPMGDILPDNERQARPLASLEPDQQSAVWRQVIDSAPTNSAGEPVITAALVERIVEESKAEEPESDETVEQTENIIEILDSLKAAIPESLHPIFSEVAEFKAMMSAISAIKGRVTTLAKSKAAGRLDVQEIERMLTQAHSLLRFSMPYTECPKCRRKLEKKCPACFGSGWLHETGYKNSASDADKKWLESR
jgi:hypothetical protein